MNSTESCSSFEAADATTRRESLAMTMDQRLEILEQLRMQGYPDGQTAPDFSAFLKLLSASRAEDLLVGGDPVSL